MYTEIYYLHLDYLDKYGGSIRLVIIIGTGYMLVSMEVHTVNNNTYQRLREDLKQNPLVILRHGHASQSEFLHQY